MTRTHLITGASSGIGLATASRLSARGDRLILLAREGSTAHQQFPDAALITADLRHPELLASIAGSIPEVLDSVVHCAGIVELGSVAELSVAAWQSQLTVNLVSAAELTRLTLPALRAARGQLVYVNSGAGLRTHPQWAAYAASKHGLKALADGVREEEAAHGIRVTSVYPGRTATPMQASVHEQEGRDYDPDAFIDAESVATTIIAALDLPPDAAMVDVAVRPGPR